jgi:membrane fusion protein (multidrug efflux system)
MNAGLFRAEALHHHAERGEEGDVLRLDKRWVRVTYAVLVVAAVAVFLFVSLCSVDEYAMGPAVVQLEDRRMVAAIAPGTVEAVLVRPSQRVEAGSVLVRMSASPESSELRRATLEFDRKLVYMLQDPSDPAIKQSLTALRAQKEQAKNALDGRVLRAPVAGYVTDVRVRPGQHVNAGDVVLAVAPDGATRVALLSVVSADYLPMLKRGQKMRFELDGFQFEYADLEVAEVSPEAVGSAEVQRLLGQERADVVRLDGGAKVVVSARLPSATFISAGRPYGYFDGLTGTATIRVRREPILVTLLPALRRWLP